MFDPQAHLVLLGRAPHRMLEASKQGACGHVGLRRRLFDGRFLLEMLVQVCQRIADFAAGMRFRIGNWGDDPRKLQDDAHEKGDGGELVSWFQFRQFGFKFRRRIAKRVQLVCRKPVDEDRDLLSGMTAKSLGEEDMEAWQRGRVKYRHRHQIRFENDVHKT